MGVESNNFPSSRTYIVDNLAFDCAVYLRQYFRSGRPPAPVGVQLPELKLCWSPMTIKVFPVRIGLYMCRWWNILWRWCRIGGGRSPTPLKPMYPNWDQYGLMMRLHVAANARARICPANLYTVCKVNQTVPWSWGYRCGNLKISTLFGSRLDQAWIGRVDVILSTMEDVNGSCL